MSRGLAVSAIAFTVYGHAAPAGSKKGFYNAKARRVIVTDDSKQSRPWKAQVADAAAQATAGQPPLEGPLLLELTFWIPRPKGHYGTGRNSGHVRSSAPAAPTVKPDLLKLARAVEDALSGIVYRDDAQITCEVLQKAYTTGQARTEIRVVPVHEPGQHRPLQLDHKEVAAA